MKIVLEPDDLKKLPDTVNPEILNGKPVFAGTRVPLEALWNNLADGASLEQFLDWFPTVSREQAEAVRRFAYQTMSRAA